MSSTPKASPATHIETVHLKTSRRTQWVNITAEVNRFIAESGVSSGVCHLYVPLAFLRRRSLRT